MSFAKLATVLLALVPAAAQGPLPTLRIEPTAGGSIFYIKNTYSQPVTAYLVELVDYPGSSFWLWSDFSEGETIAPGVELRKPISNMTVGAVPDYVKMQAAIFADGSTAGIPEKVAQLVGRRRAILETVRELVRRLEKGPAKDAAIADLKSWSESLPPLSKSAARGQAGFNQGATKAMISRTTSRLGAEPVEKVLADLRAVEQAVAASKPAL